MAGFRETETAKQFFSARNMKHLTQAGQANVVENLLSALEVVNKEALLEGAGGGIHGPASDVLSGIKQLRSAVAQRDTGFLHHEPSDKTLSKHRQVGALKAELVRNQIVTRTDLMKLYQPPIKRSQLPTANPFLSKNLIDPILTTDASSRRGEQPYASSQDKWTGMYASSEMPLRKQPPKGFIQRSYSHTRVPDGRRSAAGQQRGPPRMHSSNSMARAMNKPAIDRIGKRLQFLKSTNEQLQH